ncbi:MAG: hypothetical protein KDE31_31485, partial [Caldilineaceae bacterium]|nr:hypothetical protein [Caldilineaceae bacterium]
MILTKFYRVSGLSILIGAIAFMVHIVLRSLMTAGVEQTIFAQQGLWIPLNLLGALGAVLVIFGLPLLTARDRRSIGWLGWSGIGLITVAWMFFGLFLSLYSILVVPWLADQAPALVDASASLPATMLIAYITALVIEFIGCVLLAIPFIRGRTQPRWIGYLLPLAAIWTVAGTLLAPSGPAANLAINLLSNLGPVLLMVALGYLGLQLWSVDAAVREARTGKSFVKSAG